MTVTVDRDRDRDRDREHGPSPLIVTVDRDRDRDRDRGRVGARFVAARVTREGMLVRFVGADGQAGSCCPYRH